MSKQKLHNILILWLLVMITIFAVIMTSSCGNKTPEPVATLHKDEEADPTADASNLSNVFVVEEGIDNDGDISVTILLRGNVSICRISAFLFYDHEALELIDYDAETGIIVPLVNPPKNDDGSLSKSLDPGTVRIEWANATNVTKQTDVLKLVFRKKLDNAAVSFKINAVNQIIDNAVVEVDYNIQNSELVIK